MLSLYLSIVVVIFIKYLNTYLKKINIYLFILKNKNKKLYFFLKK